MSRLTASVGSLLGAVGVEVGQVLAAPAGQGAAQPGEFGYGTVEQDVDQVGGVGTGGAQVADLTRFWRALQRGQLLGPEQMAQMQRTVPADTFQDFIPGARYGLGIMWIPSSCGGYWCHGGDVPGTSNVSGVTSDGDRAIVAALYTRLADPDSAVAVINRSLQTGRRRALPHPVTFVEDLAR